MPRKTPAYEGEKGAFPSTLRYLMEEEYKNKHGKKDSQEALAKEIGVQRQTISGYLCGSSSPDWEKIVKIAKRYGVSTDFLLGVSGDKRIDHIAVDELGLPQQAVENLRSIKEWADREQDPDGDFHRRLEILRRLLSDKRFDKFITYFAMVDRAAERTRIAKNKKEAGEVHEARDLEDYSYKKYLFLDQVGKLLVSYCHSEDLEP